MWGSMRKYRTDFRWVRFDRHEMTARGFETSTPFNCRCGRPLAAKFRKSLNGFNLMKGPSTTYIYIYVYICI